jgi:asparagine synthase (glutamine-hydrolysing)
MRALRQAVNRWRLSDVPVGSLLSGGVDSGALAALLTELSGPIHTFHIKFNHADYDESAAAAQTAARIGSRHHTMNFSTDDFDLLPQLVGRLETPQCSATAVPIYKLYRAAGEAGFKVILTGEGADELLGGYHWYRGDQQVRRLLRLPLALRAHLAKLPLPASGAGKRVLGRGTTDTTTRFALWHEVAPSAVREMIMRRNYSAHFPRLADRRFLADRHPLHQMISLETQTRLVDLINLEVDRMSMASSVEARPPFLDHLLWEFCATLPPQLKLGPEMDKWLLRQGVANLLPAAVAVRRKQGLAAPHASWWRQEHLPAWAEEALHPAALAETGYFINTSVAKLRQAHQAGQADHSRLLMGVLTTQLWHDALNVQKE